MTALPHRPDPATDERIAALDAAAATAPDVVIAGLRDPSPLVRDRAVKLAARHLEPAQLVRLVADDADATLRNAAIAALERQGPYAVRHLGRLLDDESDDDVVMFTLQVLARIGDTEPVPAILRRLEHGNHNVRQAAVEALGGLKAAEAVEPLLALLQGDLWLQLAAIEALGMIGDERAVAPLVALLADDFLAEPAARALGRLAYVGSLPALIARLAADPAPDGGLASALVEAIGTVLAGHPERSGELAVVPAERLPDLLRPLLEPEQRTEDMPVDRQRAAAVVAVAAGCEPLWPAVLRLACDPDEDPWLERLCRRHAAVARPALRRLLGDPDPRVRRGALLAGVLEETDVPAIAAMLHDPVPEVRTAACRALGELGATAAASALVERLRGGDSLERAAAAGALGRMPAEVAELAPCLTLDAPEGVAVAALEVLERTRSRRFEAEVNALLRSRSPEVRCAALRVVATYEGSRADTALLQALADRSELVQAEALELLVERGGERSVQTLIALLSTADSVRFRVIRALGRLHAAAAVPKLQALYPDCAPHEQLEIIAALAAIAPPGVRDFLRIRLDERDPAIRAAAARALAELADPGDLATFEALAVDPEWMVREASVRGLARVGPGGRAALMQLGRDVEPVVARAARAALMDPAWS